jgi:hypothetical protein
MGEFDLDTLVLEVVRKHTSQPSAGAASRFEEDLGLSENGRKTLFSFTVEAFTARGLNLPARGFYQSHFMACATPADVQEAIREALSGAKRKAAGAGTPPAKLAPAAPVAPAAAVASKKDLTQRGEKRVAKAKSKPKVAAKKKTPARKGRGGR